MRKLVVSILTLIALLSLAFAAVSAQDGTGNKEVPEITRTQFETPPDDIRDYRYCEIIPVFRNRLTFNVEVYNTINLNQCPAEQWNVLDDEAMADEYNAVQVILNGPRYWVINEIQGGGETASGKTVDFGGIEMNLVAVIETRLWEGTVGGSLYTENEVQRETTYTYSAGNMVYELTSPDGDVYRMQSYSQIFDPELTINDLETLGDSLDLPDGWSYEARVVEEDEFLVADGLAFVINDDFGNSYQKVIDEEPETVVEPNSVPAITRTQFEASPDDIRNYRYCEIIPVFRNRLTFNVEVYNTINLNQCPAEQWNVLDDETMADEYNAVQVILNGPRYWVINEIRGGGGNSIW